MKKLLAAWSLLLFACVISGLYGALNDQITYTVSPEYYHKLKFDQFDIPLVYRNRIGVSMVGWYAAWWMGVVVAGPILAAGLIIVDWLDYFKKVLRAFGLVGIATVISAIGGAIYAFLAVSNVDQVSLYLPKEIEDKLGFARVGEIHQFSYLGGLVGVLIAISYLVISHLNDRRSAHLSQSALPTEPGNTFIVNAIPLWIWLVGFVCTMGLYLYSVLIWFVLGDWPFGGPRHSNNEIDAFFQWLFLFYPVIVISSFVLSIVSLVFRRGWLFLGALVFPSIYSVLWLIVVGNP